MDEVKPSKIFFTTDDGFTLFGEWHTSKIETDTNIVVLVCPGMGIPARFYRSFARFLTNSGIHVMLFDYRGIGWSRIDKLAKLEASATIWGSLDLSAAIDFALKHKANSQLVGIGHSLGGSIIGFAGNISHFSKLIHIGSQSGYFGLYKNSTRIKLKLTTSIGIPLLTRILGYYPANWLSRCEPLPAGFAYEWSSWCRYPKYFMDQRFLNNAEYHHASYRGPLLSVSFEDDPYANKASVDTMASYYSKSQLVRWHLSPNDVNSTKLGHFDVFRPNSGRVFWKKLIEWI